MALRYVEIVLPCTECRFDEEWLEGVETVDHWLSRIDDRRITVCAVVQAEHTDGLLDALTRRFGSTEGFRAIVLDSLATLPRVEEPEKPPPEEEPAPPENERKAGSVSREELLGNVQPGTRISSVFVATILLSATVASVGLVRDNVAVIIGAMVIAPLLTPNMALALATTLGDLDMARKALRTLAVGGLVALGFALILGVVLYMDPLSAEITARTQPHWSDFLVALASGAAGALAFTSGMSSGLVGVMVAVALLPPLVVVGLLLGDGRLGPAFSASLLFAINVICVNLAAVVTFLWRGVRPLTWIEKDKARRYTRIAVILWAVLLLVLAGLLVVVAF